MKGSVNGWPIVGAEVLPVGWGKSKIPVVLESAIPQ